MRTPCEILTTLFLHVRDPKTFVIAQEAQLAELRKSYLFIGLLCVHTMLSPPHTIYSRFFFRLHQPLFTRILSLFTINLPLINWVIVGMGLCPYVSGPQTRPLSTPQIINWVLTSAVFPTREALFTHAVPTDM